ncbi:MAG: hypothetical protein LBQ67_03985 [Treponema sp.]|jgi:hypothetical protein|nr:hypothetical protein [Treponema sp.]
MVLSWGKKRPCLILVVYMVIAMIGIFTFSSLEPFHSTQLRDDKPLTDSFFESLDYDFLAANITFIGRGKGDLPSPLRGAFLRTIMPVAMQNDKALSFQHAIKNNEGTHHLRIKNAILLKLRI